VSPLAAERQDVRQNGQNVRSSSALFVTCRVASVALVLVLVPLWGTGTERFSTGDGFCEWSSSLGLLRYYEVSDTKRPVIHGWRFAATILLTVISSAAAWGLWRFARRVRATNLPNTPLQPTSGGHAEGGSGSIGTAARG